MRIESARRSAGAICFFCAADWRRAEKRRDDYEAIRRWIIHTVARLQEADETNEIMRKVLDDCT